MDKGLKLPILKKTKKFYIFIIICLTGIQKIVGLI